MRFSDVNAIKVDDAHRIQISILAPGDLYEPQIISADEITLRRVASSDTGSQRAKVSFEKCGGYTVGVSDQTVSLDSIKEALAEFP